MMLYTDITINHFTTQLSQCSHVAFCKRRSLHDHTLKVMFTLLTFSQLPQAEQVFQSKIFREWGQLFTKDATKYGQHAVHSKNTMTSPNIMQRFNSFFTYENPALKTLIDRNVQ